MTPLAPPRLAVTLLRRFLAHNEPLVGDLLEEFERRQSRLWLWWQVAAAIMITTFRRQEEVRPIELVPHADRRSPLRPPPSAAMPSRIGVNGGMVVTAGPIRGIGGIMAGALLLLMILINPATWSVAGLAIGAVLLLGILRILYTRRRSAVEARRGRVTVTGHD